MATFHHIHQRKGRLLLETGDTPTDLGMRRRGHWEKEKGPSAYKD